MLCVSCIWCICSSCCCVELHEIQENCKTATFGSYLTLQLLFIQICSLDIGIWCMLCIFNTVPRAECNFIRKNRKRVKFSSAESEAVYIPYLQFKPLPIQICSVVIEIWYIVCIGCICNGDSCVDLN